MKECLTRELQIHVAVADNDPLRLIGLRALLESEPDLEVEGVSAMDAEAVRRTDLVLLKDRSDCSLADEVEKVKVAHPRVRVLVTGSRLSEDAILHAIAAGARGYISENASSAEFANAIRVIHAGLIWAPRRVLASLIVRASDSLMSKGMAGRLVITSREHEVLRMLVAGRSNREIAAPLGIQERTVKAHVAHLFRKVGVNNRIALSMHVVTHSIVPLD